MAIILILYVGWGILVTALAVPLILKKVGPNSWYGFRVKETLADPLVWYAANAFAAKRFLVVGIGTSISTVLLYFVPGMEIASYGFACLAIVLSGLLVTLIQSFRFLRSGRWRR